MSRKLHPRWERNVQAKLMIGNAIHITMVKHQLTHAELVAILAESIGQWTKSAIKQEREEADLSGNNAGIGDHGAWTDTGARD